MADSKRSFWETKNEAFLPGEESMDFLHPEDRETEPSAALTETQYLGVNIPEHDIHGLCYLWHHPNLNMVSGGAWIWQGHKLNSIGCELFDWHLYVADDEARDLRDARLPNSYRTQVIDPMQRLRSSYEDAARGNRFELDYEAIMEPMVLGVGGHFEQAMRVTGSLVLGGTEYAVDSYTVRDRSWGSTRNEASMPVPPMAWMTGVFGEDLIFGLTAFDSLDRDPEWVGELEIPGGDNVRGGWIRRDGELRPVVSASKKVFRRPDTLTPERVELRMTDDRGETLDVIGTVQAASHQRTWQNMEAAVCLTRWECEGRVGYGDTQDVVFGDYHRRFAGRHEAFAAVTA